MPRCVALLDGGPGTYGIALTGLPGCTSMGCDENEAYQYAVAALDEWFE
jgi:predicted RNase H-like HicB family nuclease